MIYNGSDESWDATFDPDWDYAYIDEHPFAALAHDEWHPFDIRPLPVGHVIDPPIDTDDAALIVWYAEETERLSAIIANGEACDQAGKIENQMTWTGYRLAYSVLRVSTLIAVRPF